MCAYICLACDFVSRKSKLAFLRYNNISNNNICVEQHPTQICHVLIFFSIVVMALSCMQLCLRCRSLLCTKTGLVTRHHYTQFWDSTTVIGVPTRIVNGPLSIRWNHTETQTRHRWKHQMLFHSALTAKHLSTEATEEKYTEELSKTSVVTYSSPLVPITNNVPVTQSQMTIGMYWISQFIVVDHNIILQTYES